MMGPVRWVPDSHGRQAGSTRMHLHTCIDIRIDHAYIHTDTYRHRLQVTPTLANAVLLLPHSFTPIHISTPIHKHTHSTLIHSFIPFHSFHFIHFSHRSGA
eukprot:GHVU01175771.1.p2 GENE.GHVU01175771.1~~GHVU01175771.1.p2  ORF type:complete len:101 (-),score=4.03 GHVU01175771.1:68-370(-)